MPLCLCVWFAPAGVCGVRAGWACKHVGSHGHAAPGLVHRLGGGRGASPGRCFLFFLLVGARPAAGAGRRVLVAGQAGAEGGGRWGPFAHLTSASLETRGNQSQGYSAAGSITCGRGRGRQGPLLDHTRRGVHPLVGG